MMALRFVPIDTLPGLAWCACLEQGRDVMTLYHGPNVETHSRGFVEGAWNGDYEAFDLASATVFCGTGGVREGDRIKFLAGTDRLSPIFSVVKPGRVFVSNSPAFAMSLADVVPDNIYPFYDYDFIPIWRAGLCRLGGRVRLRSSNALGVHFLGMVTVDRNATVRFEAGPLPEAPGDFAAYRSLLLAGLRDVFENAQAAGRRTTYRPLAGISRGYDSCATAALSAQAGCRDAFTLVGYRRSCPQEDSGTENARRLGMNCTEYDHWQYLKMDGRVEAECALFANSMAPMGSLESDLPGRLVVTGHSGDNIWDPDLARCCHHMSMPWSRFPSGVGQIEFRLRVGFLMLSAATIGARRNADIFHITHSEEMRPWTLGGAYDRPIPRRLAEEAGVPREAFGQAKAHSGHARFFDASRFSPAALASYDAFIARAHGEVSPLIRQYWRAQVCGRHAAWQAFGSDRYRTVSWSPWQNRFPYLLNAIPIRIPWRFMFLFQWGFDVTRDRYRSVRADQSLRPDSGR